MMKKLSLLTVAIGAACLASAQVKKEKAPSPPPAPPAVEIKAVPPPPPAPPVKPQSDLPADYNAFLKRNPGVKNLGWSENNVVRIHLKSGKEEVYHLDNKEEAQQLKNKYGTLPVPPPPPPAPVPPAPPKAPKPVKDL